MGVETMLIEEIRATGTEESRRKALIEAVGSFEKASQLRAELIVLAE
jgi:hypothetical protein